ncbi:hypothetical protein V8G54_029913, partial [Vigna mungo]
LSFLPPSPSLSFLPPSPSLSFLPPSFSLSASPSPSLRDLHDVAVLSIVLLHAHALLFPRVMGGAQESLFSLPLLSPHAQKRACNEADIFLPWPHLSRSHMSAHICSDSASPLMRQKLMLGKLFPTPGTKETVISLQ